MRILPETTTPEALAEELGWSKRRVRELARRLGACRILGNRMVLLAADVAIIRSAAEGEIETPGSPARQSYRAAHVYFFAQSGFVKIGWSNNWRQRFVTLQAATPNEITVLAVYRGGIAHERGLHAKFAEYRVRLEWFRLCDPILQYIDENRQNCCKDARRSK